MIRRTVLSLFLLLASLPALAQDEVTVLAFGDSLTAGLGVDPQSAFPAQLEEALKAEDPITDIPMAVEVNYFQISGAEYFVPVSVRMPGSELKAVCSWSPYTSRS